MPILVDSSSRIICQGILQSKATFHTQQCLAYGSHVVGGVDQKYGITEHLGLPVFPSVRHARRVTTCTISMIFVPPMYGADAILEAHDAGVELIVCMTPHIPLHDMVEVQKVLSIKKTSRLIGPGCSGVITPGQCKVGTMPGYIYKKGTIGVISQSEMVTYEAVCQLAHVALGQSTCVDIGSGSSLIDILELFENDPQTQATVLIRSACDDQAEKEEETAQWIRHHATKPICAFIVPDFASEKKHLHSSIVEKQRQSLAKAGVHIIETMSVIGHTVAASLEQVKFQKVQRVLM